jgi:hypothetical protein
VSTALDVVAAVLALARGASPSPILTPLRSANAAGVCARGIMAGRSAMVAER